MSYLPDDSALCKLFQKGKKHAFKKGTVVQRTDNNFFLALVHKGYVKRYLITNDGSNSIQAMYGPGAVFSLTAIYKQVYDYDLYSGPEIFYYETLTDTELYIVDSVTFQEYLDKNPLIYKDLLFVAGVRLTGFITKLENTSLKISEKRVAHQLVYYAQNFGIPKGDGVIIAMPLTHSTLASALSITRETVSHSMSHLHKIGLVSSYKGRVYIPSLEKLKEEAYS